MLKGWSSDSKERLFIVVLDKLLFALIAVGFAAAMGYLFNERLERRRAYYHNRVETISSLWTATDKYGVAVLSACDGGSWDGVPQQLEDFEGRLSTSGLFLGKERADRMFADLYKPVAQITRGEKALSRGDVDVFRQRYRDALKELESLITD